MKKLIFSLLLIIQCFSCVEKSYYNIGSGLEVAWSEPASTKNIDAYVLRDTSGSIIISAFVLSIDFDSTFVIVEQEPRDLLWSDSLCYIYSLTEINQMVDTSTLRHYWIIDKRAKRQFFDYSDSVTGVFGPYSKKQFNLERTLLGVSDSLVFQNVESSSRYNQLNFR